MSRPGRGDEHAAARQRLKRLVERAAQLAMRGRALSQATRRHDRQSAVYLMNVARQAARLLQQIPASQVPTLRLPVGGGEARGLTQHVLRHTRIESGGSVVLRFLVLSSDGRLRVCAMDVATPSTRLWREYDPTQPSDDFDFEDTADALATLIDSLEQVLAVAEARLAERIARLEQRRRERVLAPRTPAASTVPPAATASPAAATAPTPPATAAAPATPAAAAAVAPPAPVATDAPAPSVPVAEASPSDVPVAASIAEPSARDVATTAEPLPAPVPVPVPVPVIDDVAAAITASLPIIEDPRGPEVALSPPSVAPSAPVATASAPSAPVRPAPSESSASAWPPVPEDAPTRKRGFRLSRLGRTI